MTDDYTPSINALRADYIALHTRNFDSYMTGRSLTSEQEHYGREFDAALAAHDAEVAIQARADALREFADMLDGAESYDVLSATKPDGVRWGEASVYDSIANSGPISDWLRIYAARSTESED